MTRVSVTIEQQAFIQERVDRCAEEAPEELQWQLPHVRAHGALPLYVGWTETAAIRPDSEMLRWSTEGDWAGTRELEQVHWVTMALVRGAERYPSLRALMPSRPESARHCVACKGTGRFPLGPEIICECAGVGWMVESPCSPAFQLKVGARSPRSLPPAAECMYRWADE
jgi:hypothetical protein